MTLVVIKIVILNQCKVIWNMIKVVAEILLVVKREACRFIRRMKRGPDILRDSRSNGHNLT